MTRPVTLAYTKGDGKEGYYNGIQDNSYLNRLQDVIIRSLKGIEQTMNTTSEKRKYIILKYKEGGENWAHRDGNSDQYFPYQAVLMFSNIIVLMIMTGVNSMSQQNGMIQQNRRLLLFECAVHS